MSGRAAIEPMFNPGFIIKTPTGLYDTKAAIKRLYEAVNLIFNETEG